MPRMSIVPARFAGLVSDAALFPPGSAPMAVAVAAHLTRRSAPWADLVGPFVCPESRLDELIGALDEHDPGGYARQLPIPVVVILDGPVLPRVTDPRVEVVGAHVRRTALGPAAAAGLAELVAAAPAGSLFVEVTDVERASDVVAAGAGVKIRTGGEVLPSVAALAALVHFCAVGGHPFVCTAGMHHAVRWQEPGTRLTQHGFLNVLLATHHALTGGTVQEVEAVLAEQDAAVVAAAVSTLGEQLDAARDLFTTFGSCDVDGPAADLRALHLL